MKNTLTKVILSVTLMLLMTSIMVFAESTNSEMGNEAYNRDNYTAAVEYYEKAMPENQKEGSLHYRYAYSLEQVNGPNNDSLYHYAQAYFLLLLTNPGNKYTGYAEAKLNGRYFVKGLKEVFSYISKSDKDALAGKLNGRRVYWQGKVFDWSAYEKEEIFVNVGGKDGFMVSPDVILKKAMQVGGSGYMLPSLPDEIIRFQGTINQILTEGQFFIILTNVVAEYIS